VCSKADLDAVTVEAYLDVSTALAEIPQNSLVALLCVTNGCFVRMAEDGRCFADTPSPTEMQRDVHFRLRRKDNHYKLRSALWGRHLTKDSMFESKDQLVTKSKKGFRNLVIEGPENLLTTTTAAKQSKFRILRFKNQPPPPSSSSYSSGTVSTFLSSTHSAPSSSSSSSSAS